MTHDLENYDYKNVIVRANQTRQIFYKYQRILLQIFVVLI